MGEETAYSYRDVSRVEKLTDIRQLSLGTRNASLSRPSSEALGGSWIPEIRAPETTSPPQASVPSGDARRDWPVPGASKKASAGVRTVETGVARETG